MKRKIIFSLIFVFSLFLFNIKGSAVSYVVSIENGASIRTKTEASKQGLRFTAKLDERYKNNKHGFYLVYGLTTVETLQQQINKKTSPIIINDKEVFKVEVKGTTKDYKYSVVLTGIPEEGYLDGLTAIPYVIVNGIEYFARSALTRSIAEVAVVLKEAGYNNPTYNEIVNSVSEHIRVVSINDEIIKVDKGYKEVNIKNIKGEFLRDWNQMFATNLNDFTASFFHEEALKPLNIQDSNNKDFTETNLYRFFALYKWNWVIDFIAELGRGNEKLIKQVEVITFNAGINSDSYDVDNLENLAYSIANFFNESDEGGVNCVSFSNSSQYDDLESYNKTVIANSNNYNYMYKENESIRLPIPTRSGYEFVGWYNNPNFTGSIITHISAGSINDKTFYAKWEPLGLSDSQKVLDAKNSLDIIFASGDNKDNVTKNITLPTSGMHSATITWATSDSNVITNKGVVTRSTLDKTVTLTATIKVGTETLAKTFILTVLKETAVDPNEEYTITFNLNGGAWPTGEATAGYTDRTNHFSPIEPITTEDHVTIDLFYGYDDLKTKQTILKGNLARKPYDPIRSGYKFLGWYLNDSLFDFNSPVNENITLMAKWEQLEVYNIEYNLNGGTLKTLGYNNRDEMITDFLTDFYNFLNLDIDLNTFMHGDGNVSGYDGLYNNEEYYKYLYMANNKEIDATTGMFINQPEFNKWTVLLDLMEEYTSTGNTNQTGEFWGMPLVVGINRIKPFIRQINLWSYSSAEKNETIMEILNRIPSELVKVNVVNSFTIETPNIILPVAEKEGHNFLGWYLNENFTGDVIENIPQGTNNNISLYAKFSINQTDKVTITFYLNYANIYLPLQEINKGDKVKEPTSPVRSGYNFMGWYLGDVLFDFNQNIEDSIVLVAAWDLTEDIETVKVSFDLDYDDKYLDDVIIEKGTIVEEPITPSRENYKFLGWYFGDELYNFNVVVNENICLKAKWEALKVYDEVVLYFDLGYDGLYLPSVTIEKGTSFYEPYEPVREGYEFVGWTLEDILFDFSQPINTNLTFTAFWKSDGIIKEHIITFSLGYDDLILDIKTVLSGSKLTSVIKPTREGYVFAGWYYGLIRFDFTKEIYEDYLLVARWNEEINVSEKVVTLDGASIRTTVEGGVQRLRFYGKIDSSLVGSEFGFYAVYGKTTVHDLMEKIRENDGQTMYINGRDVKRQAVNKADYNNEFSVVLTGIPKIGYADLLSVVAYAVDKEGNLYLAENVVSRSVLEVAVKMEEANEVTNETQDIIAYAKANMLKLDYDVYGNLEISSSLYEVNHRHIKEVFFKDWNTLFNTSFVDPSANEFFSSAKKGSNNPDRNNTNISNTNIYKFFNNEIYKDKWGWFLDYFKEVDYTIHATGQIEAIKGNGTYTNPNLSSNRNRLYNATHLTHSIYNFFYETNENGGYPAINFYNEGNLNDGLNKYDRYLKVKDFNDKIYIDISSHQVFRMGESIILPEIKETPTSGTTYVYFDGNKYYAPNSYYNVNGKTTFEIREVVVSVYEIKFYDNDVELIELRDYYLIDEGKELPVISKEGYDFMGWYSDASFTGTPITKINKGNSLDKTFYAKWEKTDAKINIVYDFGEYGYHSTTKLELFAEFRKDYKEFYNLDYPIGNTIYDFYNNSKLTLPNKIEEIFLDSQMGEKWDWLENYILIKAQENNYIHLADLQNYNEDVWRLNIQSFFIDGLYINSESSFVSLDFSSLELAYSFWKYTKYNMYEASYNKTDRLVSSDAVKSWNDEYEFAYWVNEQGKIVNDLSILNNETYYLKAVWKKK